MPISNLALITSSYVDTASAQPVSTEAPSATVIPAQGKLCYIPPGSSCTLTRSEIVAIQFSVTNPNIFSIPIEVVAGDKTSNQVLAPNSTETKTMSAGGGEIVIVNNSNSGSIYVS